MAKLTELHPRFIRHDVRTETWSVADGDQSTWRERGCPVRSVTGPREHLSTVTSLQEAQGIMFQCPLCYQRNGHFIQVTFADRGVADPYGSQNSEGRPSRWTVTGTGMEDLTLRPSIWLKNSCGWHGYVTNGVAE